MLDDLLRSDKVTDEEEEAFRDMRTRVGPDGLTRKQREWVSDRYRLYDLDAEEGSKNLFSSGQVKVTDAERAKKYPWEFMKKPLKPPGRK